MTALITSLVFGLVLGVFLGGVRFVIGQTFGKI